MPREQSKCREWEKERRNRLNDGFTILSKLLPLYDPSITVCKADILKNAATFIEELQAKIKVLISENNEEATKKVQGEEFKKLHDRIKRLLSKNEQLCGLLRQAKITIPPGCIMAKKFKVAQVWSNRILPDEVKTLQKKEIEKENDAKKTPRKFTNKKQNKVGVQNGTPKHRKAILNRSDSKKIRPVRKKKVKPLRSSKCVIVLSQPNMTQPCYVITNAPSNNILGGTSTVISNSGLITNPMVSSKATKTVASMPPLGAGTLILANGTIMPVLPQQTVLPLAPQIITRAPIIFLPKNSTSSTTNTVTSTASTGVKVLPRIKPKYCLTKTTQVNKVPIPALTSRYSNAEVVLKKSEPKIVKKVQEKKTVAKENEKVETVETSEKRKVPIPEAGNDAKKAKIVEEETVRKEQETVPETEISTAPCEKNTEEPEKEIEKVEAPKVPDTKKPEETLDLNINHSELSNDIFASLQVPAGCQNPESTSPTAAFLLAFPLVSSLTGVKVTEVTEEDNTDSQRETPTLLQIGTIDNTKPTQSETLTPSLLNLDNLSFFSSKDIGGFYNAFETSSTTAVTSTVSTSGAKQMQVKKIEYQQQQQTLQQVVQQQHQQSRQQQQHPQSLQQQQAKPQQTAQQQQQQHPQAQQSHQQQRPQPQQALQQHQQQQSLQQPQLSLHQHPQQLLQQPKQQSQPLQQQSQPLQQPQQLLQQPKQQSQPLQQSQQLLQQPKQQSLQQHRQDKTQLVPCFDNHNTVPTFGTTVSTNSITQPISYQLKPMEVKQQGACANNYNQKTFPCNTFNEGPKVGTNIKNYPEPLYTNSTYGNSDANFNQTYYKDIPKSDNRSYYSLNYENYADYRKNDTNSTNTYFPSTNYYSNANYSKDKFNSNTNNTQKNKGSTQTRPPINWMTTPDNRLQTPTDYVLPQFTKESEFYPSNTFTNTQTTYFNTNPMYPANTNEAITNQEPRKSLDLSLVPPVNSYQRNEVEDNQFTWSPTKIPQFLDPPHSFVSSTLPTLVGDLALGNPLTFGEQKDKCVKKDRRVKYEGNQGNFLSVSQLVDHVKEVVPARTTTRRNSGGRSSGTGTGTGKKVPQKAQRKESKDVYGSNNNNSKVEVGKGMKQLYSGGDVFCDSGQKNRVTKNNNYSAEALIGSQMQDKRQQNYNNKPISVSSFLHDNIIPYFPSVDLPQDNSYIQQNQTYQTSSFSHNFPGTFQNNTYTANSFIPTTTISSTYNFMHDVGHDYDLFPAVSKDKTCKNANRNVREQQCTTSKKSKRKHSNDLPGFVDFPSFLSMPSSINSPILPDDFHTHTNFLQPTPQLYPCKNPFTKPNDLGSGSLLPLPPVPGTRSNIQHPEISPLNSAGTSLTNFNLSTIFPEINNKGALDAYSEPRVPKDNARSYTSTVQVSFNDKPTFSFSYINCTTSQTYSNQ